MKKVLIHILVLTAVLITLSACGGNAEDFASAPFGSSDYQGRTLDDVVSQLEAAGFTAVETKSKEISSESKDGTVSTITINGKTLFRENNKYYRGVPVVVSYYVMPKTSEPELFEVSIDIEENGDAGKPEFIIKTNLPEGAVLSVELSLDGSPSDGQKDFVEQRNLTISGGTATTGAFTDDGEPLAGDYKFGVVFLPSEQPEQVKKIVGENGENLSGTLVESLDNYQYISASIDYHSTYENNVESGYLSLGDIDLAIRTSLTAGFGENYTLNLDGHTYTATVWGDGVAMNAALAANGYTDALEVWNKLVDSTLSAAESLQSILNNGGHDDKIFIMQVANDMNEEHDIVLLSVSLGTILYDYVNGIDLLG